jgi:hypothetical protein
MDEGQIPRKTMDTKKITQALRARRAALKRNSPGASWTKYLKGNGIRRVGIIGLTKMANKGELQGKTVVQTDFDLTEPARTAEELEGLHADFVYFYVMDKETAEKILVLGLP